jgi:hypothetical protein
MPTRATACVAYWSYMKEPRAETERAEGRDAVAAYASEMAGTSFDLDPLLEAAAIEQLIKYPEA